MIKKNPKITNFYFYSFLLPSEKSIQALNNVFKTKKFVLDSNHVDLYAYTKSLYKQNHRSMFELYLPNTMSIMIDKKIAKLREIVTPTLVTTEQKKWDEQYKNFGFTDFYDSLILKGDIPIKYIKGIILPSNKIIYDSLIYSLFLGKHDIKDYIDGFYTDSEISAMRLVAERIYSLQERQKYLREYCFSLDGMMMQNNVYIPQLFYNEENPKTLIMR